MTKIPEQKVADIEKLKAEGKTLTEVSNLLKMPSSTVYSYFNPSFREHQKECYRKKKLTKPVIDAFEELTKAYSVDEIVAACGGTNQIIFVLCEDYVESDVLFREIIEGKPHYRLNPEKRLIAGCFYRKAAEQLSANNNSKP